MVLGNAYTDLTSDMDRSGAILTKIKQGPSSNGAYGTAETTLIQNNGDPNTDLLYTANFALVGLHEAADLRVQLTIMLLRTKVGVVQ